MPEKLARRARQLPWPRPIGAAAGAVEGLFLLPAAVRFAAGIALDLLSIPGTGRLALRISRFYLLGIDREGFVAAHSWLRASLKTGMSVMWTASPDEVRVVREGRIFSKLRVQDRHIIMRRSSKDYALGLWG